MDKHHSIQGFSKYNAMYKKSKKQNFNHNYLQKSMIDREDMTAYDAIISKAKNTIDVFQRQLEQTIPSIVSYEHNMSSFKKMKTARFPNTPSINKSNFKSERALSGNSLLFQPILTELGNISKSQISIDNENINDNNNNAIYSIKVNSDEHYKNLYHKAKNENIKLNKKINELENKNLNNERIILDFMNEKAKKKKKIKELETIISEYENNSNTGLESSMEKNQNFIPNNEEFILLNSERNKYMQENNSLKEEISKILKENNNLKIRIKYLEKNNENSTNSLNANNYVNRTTRTNEAKNMSPNYVKSSSINLVNKNNLNQQTASYNKSFRVISNLSLYNKSNVEKPKKSHKRVNRTETDLKLGDNMDN